MGHKVGGRKIGDISEECAKEDDDGRLEHTADESWSQDAGVSWASSASRNRVRVGMRSTPKVCAAFLELRVRGRL